MTRIVLVLITLTGFSGLVFQIIWQRYFSFLFGGEALSSALVVSVFLGGLSAGYALFGRIANGRDSSTLLRLTGYAEIGIGLWALFFPILFSVLWRNLALLPTTQPFRFAVDFLLSVILMGPSTLLMGSTLPLLTRALSGARAELSSVHARVYGLNTLGAFLGSILSGFYLVERFGLAATMITASFFNLCAGALIVYLSRTVAAAPESSRGGSPQAATSAPPHVLLLALLAGFTSIGFEILFIRSVSLAVGTSEYSYSLVVGVFVLMIALGTLSLHKRCDATSPDLFRNQAAVILGLILLYLSVPYWGWLTYVLRTSLPENFALYYLTLFVVLAILMALPVFFMGRIMPLLFSSLKSGLDGAGRAVGRIYAVNTVGCCLGGVVMGYLFLLYFEADEIFRFGILLSALMLIVIALRATASRRRKATSWGVIVLALSASLFLPEWPSSMMTAGLFRTRNISRLAYSDPRLYFEQLDVARQILYYRDDPNQNVAVMEVPLVSRSLIVNGKSDGSTTTSDLTTTLLLGHLPGLFGRAEGDAAVIGLGLGTTAQAISVYSHVPHVDVFEIARGVIDAQEYFASVNKGITSNPKVEIHQMDAFRGLMSAPKRFAVVISEPSNPWVSGVERLYTDEFYKAVKAKLLPGGVFAQWMHTYEMSPDTFAMAMRTFTETFPHYRIFFNSTDLIILGSDQPWNEENWVLGEKRWQKEDIEIETRAIGLHSIDDFALQEVFYPRERLKDHPLHSLFRPRLGYRAARDFFYDRKFDLAEVQIDDPVHSFFSRRMWNDSLLARAMAKNGNMSYRLLETCAKVKNGIARFDYERMGGYCKSRILQLTAKGWLKPPTNQIQLLEAREALTHAMNGTDPSRRLTAAKQAQLLKPYPLGVTEPPVRFIESLRKGCESEADAERCAIDVSRLGLKFGDTENAKAALSRPLKDQRLKADWAQLQRDLEGVHHLKEMRKVL